MAELNLSLHAQLAEHTEREAKMGVKMTEKKAQIIFERFNPEEAVTRCPKGRAAFRTLLDTYARAAVNLYGIISVTELVEIFNRQNADQTNADEVFTLLLPLVLKSKWYCFYKDYIVHYWAFDDFDYADYWLEEQGDKQRFIPEKKEFLKFENQYYESETQVLYWEKIREFIFQEWSDSRQRYRFYNELKESSNFNAGFKEISELLDKCRLEFRSDMQIHELFNLYTEAHNNTRMWSNKGYSPNELTMIQRNKLSENGSPEITMQKRVKIGVNDPCPCGSGRKYKKCCRLIEESKTAQLSGRECILFYETWYGLMGFINEQEKVINAVIKPVYPNLVGDEQIYKVREILWERPKWIDDYLDAVNLPEEKVKLLLSWRDHHKKGMFFVVDYKPEYAIIIGPDEQKKDRLYGIKGISRALTDVMQRELPIQFETVLLPFKDKIIYDGFIKRIPISFGEGAKSAFREMYEKAQEHGVITGL